MGRTKVTDDFRGGNRPMGSVSAPVDGVSPEVLLNLDPGTPRGFWAREGRWFAHLGVAATLEVDDPREARDRFTLIWSRAQKLFDGCISLPDSPGDPPPPRLFGGFAFREGHSPEGAWKGFPSAMFVLPEVELRGGDGKGVLTCRAFLEPGEDSDRCRRRLNQRLDQIRNAIQAPAGEPRDPNPWIPSTRVETEEGPWAEAVRRALTEVAEGDVEKVVLARVQTVLAEGGLDPVDVAMNLWRDNPGAHVFLFEPRAGHILLGAAPETVATVADGQFRATAVAGSVGRGDSEVQQKTLAADLLESSKDRWEHQMCVEDMVQRLRPLSGSVHAEENPHVLTLSTIQHLETVIEADLLPGEHVLSVLQALHPTPAVCGFPRDLALDFLRREERFHRGWYSGPVGWLDGSGNGVFVPALRSAVGVGSEWRLFAGAGIVEGSDPRREWEETRIKFQPVLRALAQARASGSQDHEAAAEGV